MYFPGVQCSEVMNYIIIVDFICNFPFIRKVDKVAEPRMTHGGRYISFDEIKLGKALLADTVAVDTQIARNMDKVNFGKCSV